MSSSSACNMNKDKQGITWFEPFSEKEAGSSNESSGLLGRFFKRTQRSTVQIDAQKQCVKFEKAAVESRPRPTPNRVSTSEAELNSGETTNATVYSPPRTLSTVIDRLDTLGRSKVWCITC